MKANFRTVAFDETALWRDLPKGCTRVFGLYLFCEGERTYCCSLTPSSWCEFLENVFIGLDNAHPFVEEHQFYNGWESGHYVSFIDVEKLSNRVSEPIEFENDRDDFDSDDEAREDLWEQAREYVRGNALEPPCLWKEMTA